MAEPQPVDFEDQIDEGDLTDEDLDALSVDAEESDALADAPQEKGEAGEGVKEGEEKEEGGEAGEAEEAEGEAVEEEGEATEEAVGAAKGEAKDEAADADGATETPSPETPASDASDPLAALKKLAEQNPQVAQYLQQVAQQQQLQQQLQQQALQTPQAQQPAQAPQTPAVDPQQQLEQFMQARAQAEELLAQYYSLQKEDLEALEEDPTEFLKTAVPKIAARVYTDAVLTSIQRVQQAMPVLLQQQLEQHEQSRSAEERFFQQWPQLREHKDAVTRIAAAYRQINPDMPMEQFMRDVGVQAMVMLGLAAEEPQQQKSKEKPFKPAARKKAPTALSAPAPKNHYELLDEELFGEE